MKLTLRFLAPVFAGLVSLAVAQTPATPAAAPAAAPAIPDASAAIPKTGNARFFELHEKFLARGKAGPIGVLFLGDSITEGWTKVPHIWEHYFGKYQPANFGIGGDQTQHVIWRIENGELDGISPKAVVLMIGTNNSGQDTAEGIAKGITVIIETIRAKQPQAKILLLAVFPRGSKPDGQLNAQNDKLKEVNAIIAKLDDGKNIHYLDIGGKFPVTDGKLDKAAMPDFLHLSPAGYQIWADAITPKLAELMK